MHFRVHLCHLHFSLPWELPSSVCWVLCCNALGVQSCISEAQDVLPLVRILAFDNWLSSAAGSFCVGWACELRVVIERMCFSYLYFCLSTSWCMFLFFFFSFVRITTYGFLMLLKILYEFMRMLWWLLCALKVCHFSGQDSCSFRLHHLKNFHMYSGKKSGLYKEFIEIDFFNLY